MPVPEWTRTANPHKDVQFSTSWDGIFGRAIPDGALSEEEKLKRVVGSLLGDQGDVEKASPKEQIKGGMKM